jgi:hypothetical protein
MSYLIAFILLFGVALFAWDYGLRRHRSIARRQPISLESIHQQYYREADVSLEVLRELWMEVSRVLKIDGGHLRPSDRFGRDVGRGLITTDELDELALIARQRAGALGVDLDPKDLATVDDYVRFFARAMSAGDPDKTRNIAT